MFQLELIRQITFWCLFAVSAFLSANLYVNLAQGFYSKVFMVVIAIVIEGVKILCLTTANTARWQSAQHKINHMREAMLGFFSRKKRKSIRDPELLRDVLDSSQKSRRAVYLYAAYILTAFLSVAASFGYILQTVNHATTFAIAPTNQDTIAIYKDTLNQYDSQIKDNQKTIAQDSSSIDKYNKLIDKLDTNATDFQQNRSVYQGNINAYQKQITQLQQTNIDLQNKRIDVNDKIQNYSVQDIQTTKTVDKTMYQLMGEVLAIPDKTIMFVLLYILAFILEIGLFICSPHFHQMDDDKPRITFKSVKKEKEELEKEKREEVSAPQEANKAPAIVPVGKPPVENTGSMLDNGYETTPLEIAEEMERSIPLVDDMPPPVEIAKMIDPPAEFVNEEDILLPSPEPVPATTTVEVEEIPIKVTKTVEDRFIDALFAMGDKHYLKDKYLAAEEAGMTKYDALQLHDFLNRAKVGTYFIIEYRQDTKKWHSNFTSEWVKAYIKQHYLPTKKATK